MSVHISSKCPVTVRSRTFGSTRPIAFQNFDDAKAHNGSDGSGSYKPAGQYQGPTICDTASSAGTTECCRPQQKGDS